MVQKTADFFQFHEAREKFQDQFQARTGNKWTEREFFEEKPGKFKMIDEKKKE